MANELNIAAPTGLTLEAAIYANNWAQQGSNIVLTETGAGTGLYVGSVPGAPAIADGVYQVLFIDTIGPPVDRVIGRGLLYWTALAEDREAVQSVLADVLADTSAIEPLVTANLDATVSSRATPADIAASEANILAAIAALNDLSQADVQAAMTAQGYTSARALLLDLLDAAISTRATPADIAASEAVILAAIASLNDLSQADVQAALTAQGYTTARAILLDFLDVAVSSRSTPAQITASETNILAAIAALNNISVADILTAVLGSGNTVDAELSAILALSNFIQGGRDIDFVGSDVLGWQRIERDPAGVLLRRYNLFDESGSRINETVASFIARSGMISSEVAI